MKVRNCEDGTKLFILCQKRTFGLKVVKGRSEDSSRTVYVSCKLH